MGLGGGHRLGGCATTGLQMAGASHAHRLDLLCLASLWLDLL